MGFFSRFSQAKFTVDVILVIAALFLFVIPKVGGECHLQNPECGPNQYCGLDNKCHAFPVKEVVVPEQTTVSEQAIFIPLLLAALIIGGALWYRHNGT